MPKLQTTSPAGPAGNPNNTSIGIRYAIPIGCLFLSGFAGLLYEVCWIRKAAIVFGTATHAVSTVVAVFFAGLAAGSYTFGRLAQRLRRPLLVYAALEIALGCFGFLSPMAFVQIDALFGVFYPSIADSFALLSLARLVFVCLLLLPPTYLMGATLPLFCRPYVRTANRLSMSVGLLYGWNTLGAAVGCAACGFAFIPRAGVHATIYIAAIINIAVGILAWVACAKRPAAGGPEDSGVGQGTEPVAPAEPSQAGAGSRESGGPQVATVYALFFLSGFVILGNEILWTRFLSLVVRNSVYTYTLTLTTILTGIVLGSVLTSAFSDRTQRRALIFGLAQLTAAIAVLSVLMLPSAWWRARVDPSEATGSIWLFALLLLLPATLSGVTFPLAIRMVVERPSLAALGVGKMTAVNTVGGITGALTIGFLALPSLGLHASLLVTTGTGLFAGIAALVVLERTTRGPLRAGLIIVALLVWVAVPHLTGTRLPAGFLADRGEVAALREGHTGHLAIVDIGRVRRLEIDRLWQGENRKSHQVMAAHVPMLLHSDPRSVLVIGLGAGQTCARTLMYDIQRLDCVDIEARLFDLVREYFDAAWMDDPRVHLIIDDGRNYLAHALTKYDLISIEVGQIFRPGIASFYTADFYRVARERVRPGGLVCQFVPIPFFNVDEFRTVIRSFIEVFPQSVLWYNTSELLLVGATADRIRLDPQRLALLSSNPAIRQDLRFALWGGPNQWLNRPEAFLGGFLAGSEGLAALSAGAAVYRDDLPSLEYSTAHHRQSSEMAIAELLRENLEPIGVILAGEPATDIVVAANAIRQMNLRDVVASAYKRAAEELPGEGRHDERVDLLRTAVRWNPQSAEINRLLGDALVMTGDTGGAQGWYSAAVEIDPDNAAARHGLGRVLHLLGDTDGAIAQYTASIQLDADNADAHNNLGVALAAAGRFDEAAQLLSKAVRLDPDFTDAHNNLANALVHEGRIEEAIGHYEAALRIKPDDTGARTNLAGILAAQGKTEEAIRQYRLAIQLYADNGEIQQRAKAHHRLARLLADQGRIGQAISHYRAALEINADDALVRADLQAALARQK